MGNYVYNSSLSFVKASFNGNRISDNRFTNFPYPDPNPSWRKVIKWKLGTNPQKEEKKNEDFNLQTQSLAELPPQPERYLIWLGHASFFIQLGPVRILTDPVIGNISLLKRKAAFPVPAAALKNIDFILISHAHRDHFDKPSIKQVLEVNPGAQILGPLRIHPLLEKLSPTPAFQEAGWYQEFDTGKGIRIVFLPAIHWHRRGLFDFNEVLWGSFYISDGERSIFFAGDTAYNKHFKSIAEAVGSTDVALMPIGAYKPEFLMSDSHLSPQEAVKGFNQLKSKLMVPMHYGTFDLADEPLGEPIRNLHKLNEQGLISGKLKALQPGEILEF